jgi:hypothetical protein
LRAAQSLPGVGSNDDFDSRFSLRGADYYRIGLYLDDILLHAPFHTVAQESASGSITAFNGDMLDSLSLHSGVFPARYGDRTAGILDAGTRGLAPGSQRAYSQRVHPALAEGPLGKAAVVLDGGARKSYLQHIIRRTAPDAGWP